MALVLKRTVIPPTPPPIINQPKPKKEKTVSKTKKAPKAKKTSNPKRRDHDGWVKTIHERIDRGLKRRRLALEKNEARCVAQKEAIKRMEQKKKSIK